MTSTTTLAKNFATMKNFSLPGDGITRLAFSDEDWNARDFIIGLMKQAGLSIRIDSFGNIFGHKEGQNPHAPAVMCGSHIDSVPHGGNFDGVLGVLGAIEAINRMNKNGFINYNPLKIVVFMCEESSRFGVATLGSKAMCGELTVNEMKRLKDASNNSLYDVLLARNLHPDNVQKEIQPGDLKACIEMHIEQGKVLETLHKTIGVVTGIAAPTRMKLMLTGKADHSGATPMGMRNDALCAAAEIIIAVENAAANSVRPAVGTVGIVKAAPNVMNVIPGKVELGIDIRSIYSQVKTDVTADVKKSIESITKNRNIDYKIEMLSNEEPVKLNPSVIDTIATICENKKITYHKMPSGAGHDTMHLAQLAPAGMIFIPCRDGISHNPAEWVDMDDIEQGVNVLYETLCCLSSNK
ncbi:M20 family metallo-hydrolase [Pectinatus frisingensis]|uniref:M20 family metallo-hydrolase n=1 Tax=Pectinatus frisingensis TaxID=865 RepID=UPI0018C66D74|nr:M20 family metallo-hydrolase [Pectinatus frisingensis]